MATYLSRAQVLLVAGTTMVVGLSAAAPAHADQYDYVSYLDNKGVYYSSISGVIDEGKLTCRLLRSGAGVPAAMNFLGRAGHAVYESATIVVAAVDDMCPDVKQVVKDLVNHRDNSDGQVQT